MNMPQFRKKPVVIDAFLFENDKRRSLAAKSVGSVLPELEQG